MSNVLLGLASLFRKSASGRKDSSRDFICDYEQLLRHAGCADGDERESAENDLKRAERESAGLLSIDRAARSHLPMRIRLSRQGGEEWIFQQLGENSPGEQRLELASFFKTMAARPVPDDWREAWEGWCGLLEGNALSQGPVQPFKRDDRESERTFSNCIARRDPLAGGVAHPFRKQRDLRDSKRLEAFEGRLLAALEAIRGDAAGSLEDFGILKKPRTVAFHGPLVLKFENGTVDFGSLPGPAAVSEINLIRADEVLAGTSLVLTVENEEVFLELSKRNPGWLLVHTSFPGAAVRRLLQRLRPDLRCFHFGDSDPAGFDILRDLREKIGRDFKPVCMEFRPADGVPPLTADERSVIRRLLGDPLLSDVHPVLREMEVAGTKGMFEQESVALHEVIARLPPNG